MNMIKKAVEWYCIASSALYSANMGGREALDRFNGASKH